tara:strand:+ start:1440 stop:1835 length:396 start_codon:yes stop_codon:yes gene_type:complete
VHTKVILFTILGAMLGANAQSHEQTPAYPRILPSHVQDVVKIQLQILNRRKEINYYEVGLFDKNFDEIDFTTKRKIIKIDYEEKIDFDVYLRKSDLHKAVYICTASKILKSNKSRAIVSSIVCSKLGGEPL